VYLLVCAVVAFTRAILSDYQLVFRLCGDWAGAAQMENLSTLASLLCFVCVISFWFCLRRRLHDLGYSGWWVFLVIASGAGLSAIAQMCVKENLILPEMGVAMSSSVLVICLAIGLIPSQKADNKYGKHIEESENWLPDRNSKHLCLTIGAIVIIAYAAMYFAAALHVAALKDFARQHYTSNVSKSYLHN